MNDLLILKLIEEIQELKQTIVELRNENARLRRALYGPRSEKHGNENPVEDPQDDAPPQETPNDTPPKPPKPKTPKDPKGGRRNSGKNRAKLQTEDVVHDILMCSHCNSERLTPTGTEVVSEEIEYIPAHLLLRKHHCTRKRCLDCNQMVIAQGPVRVTENGDYGPGLHAYVAVSKCADSMPLHRLSCQFRRQGVDLGRSTLGDIFHRTAKLLIPIYNRLCEIVKASFYVGADETPLDLFAQDKCKRGYIWTFHCAQAIIYLFEDTRSGEVAKNFLANTSGVLTADGYAGYNSSCTSEGRSRSGCWAHVRRKFFESLNTAKEDATAAMLMIGDLYNVEFDAAVEKIIGTDAHLAMRKKKSSVIIERLKHACVKWKGLHPPKSPMGKAVTYAENQWSELTIFLDDANIRLDNNLSENALRIIAIGRKNFMFVGTKQAGQNLAILQSIIATCRIHGVNPQTYISDILIRMHTTPMSKLDELLPMNWVQTPQ